MLLAQYPSRVLDPAAGRRVFVFRVWCVIRQLVQLTEVESWVCLVDEMSLSILLLCTSSNKLNLEQRGKCYRNLSSEIQPTRVT